MWIRSEDVPGSPLSCCLVVWFPSGGGEQLDQNACVAEHPQGRLFHSSASHRPSPLLGNREIQEERSTLKSMFFYYNIDTVYCFCCFILNHYMQFHFCNRGNSKKTELFLLSVAFFIEFLKQMSCECGTAVQMQLSFFIANCQYLFNTKKHSLKRATPGCCFGKRGHLLKLKEYSAE